MYSFSYLEPVCCSMSCSNCCFLTYMSNTVLWPPASVVLRAGPHNQGWCRKLWVPFLPLITLADPQGLWDFSESSCGIDWPAGNNSSGIKHWSSKYWAQGGSQVLEEGLKYKNICQARRKLGQGLQKFTGDHGEGEVETIKLRGWVFRSFFSSQTDLETGSWRCIYAQLCPTLCDPWDVTHQAPLSIGFPKQEY